MFWSIENSYDLKFNAKCCSFATFGIISVLEGAKIVSHKKYNNKYIFGTRLVKYFWVKLPEILSDVWQNSTPCSFFLSNASNKEYLKCLIHEKILNHLTKTLKYLDYKKILEKIAKT